ncbi:hypothetical protein Bca52824_064388 [Brassica carinata]|uniref:Uncharacterized protein n=1 Tax=Brassica carinata TaxID=52824 RepID=A0A8X7QHT5_BRACI|nr:hypothetical protein Bca52824_064388 [Brassica carinata]
MISPATHAIVRGSPSGNLQTSLMKVFHFMKATQFMDKRKYTNRLTPERAKKELGEGQICVLFHNNHFYTMMNPYAQLRLIEYASLSYKYYTLLLLFGVSRKEICSQFLSQMSHLCLVQLHLLKPPLSHVNMNMHKGTWVHRNWNSKMSERPYIVPSSGFPFSSSSTWQTYVIRIYHSQNSKSFHMAEGV